MTEVEQRLPDFSDSGRISFQPEGSTVYAGALAQRRVEPLIDISVLVPTRNEASNVAVLAETIEAVMSETTSSWELLFLDDSDDATPEIVIELTSQYPEVSLIHRPPSDRAGGLAGAVTAGFAAARGRALVVMDGDFQHPPSMVRQLARPVLSGACDLAVASRYIGGASAHGLSSPMRRLASTVCTGLAHLLVPGTRRVRDPMSGFFAVSRESVDHLRLQPHGFKILMELLARSDGRRVMELPFDLEERADGTSKAGTKEGLRFVRHLGRLVRPKWTTSSAFPARVLTRTPIMAILVVQAWLSTQLIRRNTAFVDEATYLSAGHFLLHAWFHKSPDMHFPTYFSGAPTIYPPLAALADDIGGLTGARCLSLAFMLISTLLAYAAASRLWGLPAGWLAAGLFATTQGTQFLGALATYDAMALMLTALAAWIVVRCAATADKRGLIYLSALVMVLANATKYASAIYDPVVIGVAFFAVAAAHGFRPALRVAATISAFLVMGLAILLAFAPQAYLAGISSTTLNRAASTASATAVLHDSWRWVGLIAVVSLGAAALCLIAATTRLLSWWSVGLIAVTVLAVCLAPVNQARIHTATSLSKHVTFGAWFGAVGAASIFYWMAAQWSAFGWLAARWRRRRTWRVTVAAGMACVVSAGALLPAGVAATHQARWLDGEWSNSKTLISVLRPLAQQARGQILVDNADIPRYYLENEVALPRWVATYYYAYTPPGSSLSITGPAAYAAAVQHGVFSVIALDYGVQAKVDHAIAAAIHTSGLYAWVGDFTSTDDFGRDTYVVWRTKSEGAPSSR